MLTSELTVHMLKCIVRGHVCCSLIHDFISFHFISFHYKLENIFQESHFPIFLSFLFSSSVSADVYDGQVSPLEAVVLNAMMTGSSVLNLRAHFLNRLPDLSSLAGMLTHLNLSFNDLWVSMKLVTTWCFLT